MNPFGHNIIHVFSSVKISSDIRITSLGRTILFLKKEGGWEGGGGCGWVGFLLLDCFSLIFHV